MPQSLMRIAAVVILCGLSFVLFTKYNEESAPAETEVTSQPEVLDNPLAADTETIDEPERSQDKDESALSEIPVTHSTTNPLFTDTSGFPDIVQSSARPRGLDIRAYVQAAASDKVSKEFAEDALPAIHDFLDGVFEYRKIIDESSENLKLEDLVLKADSNVRVYFVKEGTIFHNSLGMYTEEEQFLIFPDASSAHSYFKDAETRVEETSETIPLLPGDFVDLGIFAKGEILDFFLIHDGARQEDSTIFWAEGDRNDDGTNHVKLHGTYDENTLIIGFEDIPGGGDKDFNDVVIAVEITEVY